MIDDTRYMRYLVALADHQSFRKAAEACHVTQPALSQAVRRLEDQYGVTLFERRRNRVVPTTYCEILLRVGRKLVAELDNAKREIRLIQNLERGHLVVGAHAYMSEFLVGPALGRVLKSFSGMRCSLEIGGWDLMLDALLDRRIDVYVGFPLAQPDSRIHEVRANLPALVGICRPGHPFLERSVVRVRDLPEFPIAAPRAPHWILEDIQRRAGIERDELQRPPKLLIASDFGVIRRIVMSTDATGSVFPDMVRDEVERGELATFRIHGVLPRTPLSIGYLAERSLPPLAEAFVAEISEEVARATGARRAGAGSPRRSPRAAGVRRLSPRRNSQTS
jgi:DNA-binding transcriptional LysR family regulator